MSNFNNFGCTYVDIVNAYHGSIVSDFTSAEVIEAEIELSEALLMSKVSQKTLQMLQVVEYQEVPQVASISGSYSYTPVLPILNNLYVWQVPRYNPAKNNAIDQIYPCECTNGCPNIKSELNTQYLYTDYTLVNGTIIFGSTFDQEVNTYYIGYNVDTSTISLSSVKGMIRDITAGTLGMQLYAKGDDTWALVTHYNDRAKMWLESIDEHWFPSELRKLKFLNSPFTVKGGITSMKIVRS
jgi:hypothetical protein